MVRLAALPASSGRQTVQRGSLLADAGAELAALQGAVTHSRSSLAVARPPAAVAMRVAALAAAREALGARPGPRPLQKLGWPTRPTHSADPGCRCWYGSTQLFRGSGPCGRSVGRNMRQNEQAICVFNGGVGSTTPPSPSFRPACWPGCSAWRPVRCNLLSGSTMNPPSQRPLLRCWRRACMVRPASGPSPAGGVLRRKGWVQRFIVGAPGALWRLLTAVAGALLAIRGGQSGTTALAAVVDAVAPRCAGLVVPGLRQAGRAEALRRQLVARAPHPPPMPCCAACWRCAGTHRPRPTNRSPGEPGVEAAKHHPATRAQARSINGCLRFSARARRPGGGHRQRPRGRWNHPAWVGAAPRARPPQHWELRSCRPTNAHAPMVLRVNEQNAR